MRSKRSARQAEGSRRRASGCSAKRAAIPCGRGQRRAGVAAPQRLGLLQAHAQSRTATKASWRSRARAAWEWTSPVATQGTPSCSAKARRASGCGRGRDARRDAAARPEGDRGRRRRAAPVQRRRGGALTALPAPARTPSRAQPERQIRPSACSAYELLSFDPGLSGVALGVVAGVGVGRGEQAAEVAIAGRASRPGGLGGRARRPSPAAPRVSSAPVIALDPSPSQAWANSIEPQIPSWSVRAIAG